MFHLNRNPKRDSKKEEAEHGKSFSARANSFDIPRSDPMCIRSSVASDHLTLWWKKHPFPWRNRRTRSISRIGLFDADWTNLAKRMMNFISSQSNP
jgi:hypothetical protein